MNLINNVAEFETWKKQEYFERLDVPSPKEYPCYVYTVVSDWGMEESAVIYVYADDLRNMLAAMEATQNVAGSPVILDDSLGDDEIRMTRR